MAESTVEMGERSNFPRILVTYVHYAPRIREKLISLSHSLATIPHNPTTSEVMEFSSGWKAVSCHFRR